MKGLEKMIKDVATKERLNRLIPRCWACYVELDNGNCVGCLNREALIEILGAEAEKRKEPYQWFFEVSE